MFTGKALRPPHNVAGCSLGVNPILYEAASKTMNKGGKFLKKLWCCVGGRVEQVI